MSRYQFASELARQAVAAHEQQDWSNAASLYFQAANALRSAIFGETDGRILSSAQAKIMEYETIANTLNAKIASSKARDTLDQVQTMIREAEVAEQKKDKAQAVSLYTSAASVLLQKLNSLPAGHPDRPSVQKQIQALIAKGEQLSQKAPRPAPAKPATSVVVASVEQSTSRLSEVERQLLKESSKVNDRIFLPWMEDDKQEKFTFLEPFTDPDGLLELSPKQKAVFFAWRRPNEIVEDPVIVESVSSYKIVQELVTDCSFVSSLCIAATYETKFNTALITNRIYPQDARGNPVFNPSGKYVVKLHYNGILRKVVIDDLLPVDNKNKLLSTHSTTKKEFWPALLEKAFLKLMGGSYNFPGSNSGIDLYILTGFIPEQCFLKDENFNAETQWSRLLDGQRFGDALITIATGPLRPDEAEKLGLVPTHAYAVLQVKEINGQRLCLVKNPWSHHRWRGRFSPFDQASWTPALQQALQYDPSKERERDNGLFWIDFQSIVQYFHGVHINWNPSLFRFRTVVHSAWPQQVGPKRDTYNLSPNPQFAMVVDVSGHEAAPVWILLSKHTIKTTPTNDDFITLHVYANTNGRRVYFSEGAIHNGFYINSPHYLARLNVQPGTSWFTVVVSQHEAKRRIQFSIHTYSIAPIKMVEIPRIERFEKRVEDEWTTANAGGSTNHPTFAKNPVFRLNFSHGSNETMVPIQAVLTLAAPRTYAINIKVFNASKTPPNTPSLSSSDMVISSGDYRHGFTYIELDKNLSVGVQYYVVVSTFDPNQLGPFILTAASAAHPVSLVRVAS